MKRLLNKITNALADAALLEMGVAVEQPSAEGHEAAAGARVGWFKRFLHDFSITMADAALLEIGLPVVREAEKRKKERDTARPAECHPADSEMCLKHAA